MNWKVWGEVESVLVQHGVKPLLAVVPDNRDPVLNVDAPAADFWDHVRRWQGRGWTIALHGFQHTYVSRDAGLVGLRRRSEFAGLPAPLQREKLERALDILARERIPAGVWIAPGHTFDATTVELLAGFGIRIISDGNFHFPFLCRRQMTWVPQQLSYFRPAPPGVWTVCCHHNQWSKAQIGKFRADLERYGDSISSLERALEEIPPREDKWSEWLCTHPRFSSPLIRLELKVWEWRRAVDGSRRIEPMNAAELAR